MIDREKVINGLEWILNDMEENGHGQIDYYADEIREAITLLKEQEPVEPEVEVLNEVDRLYRCPKCHKHFFYRKQKYCDQCGQAVKWDD